MEKCLLHLAILLNELPGNNAEDLLNALATFSADLVTGVPANLLAPEAGAPLRAWAPGFNAARREIRLSIDGRGGRGWRATKTGGQVFGYVSDAALKGNLAKRWVAGNNIGFRADDVQHDI